MRSLSATLLAAQKSPTGRPYIKVEVEEKLGAVTRFNWTRLYDGAEADCFHALTIPGDGSLNRLRVSAAPGTLYRQRVTSPGPASDFSAWTEWVAGGGGGPWLSGYGYRKEITITGTTAGAQTNYQMKLTVHKGSGSDSGSDVYLNNHCQDDFDDIRFTKSDEETQLDHWRESYVSGDYAVLWIEFHSIPASPNTATFYIYYSNAGASSGSNGGNTFPFFDDFPGSSIDTNKWEGDTGNASVSGGIMTFAQATAVWKSINTISNHGAGYRLRTRCMFDGTANAWSALMMRHNFATPVTLLDLLYKPSSANNLRVWENGAEEDDNATNIVPDEYHIYELYRQASSSKAFKDDVEMTGSPLAGGFTGDYPAGFAINAGEVLADWVLFRKYVSPEPTWTSWGSEEEPTLTGTHAVTLCSRNAEILAFRVEAGDSKIYRCESANNGASWGSWVDTGLTPGSTARLAAAFKGNGDVLLLFSIGGTQLYGIKRTSGVWGSLFAWTNTLNPITGVAVTYLGDWNIIVTGVDANSQPGVWACIYGDGYSVAPGSWSSLKALTLSSPASNVDFYFPTLALPDAFRTFFVEKHTGSEAYSRPDWSHAMPSADFISNLWRDPIPFNLASDYGLALTHHALSPSQGYVWLTRPDAVWRAPLTAPSVQVTADVIGVTAQTAPFHGGVAVTLRNDDGRFNTLGSGTYEAIKKASKVKLSYGFTTAEGDEASLGPAYWIEGWEYITGGGKSHFVLYASDGWDLLDRWKAGRQFTWSAGDTTIYHILSFIFARAGIEFSSYSSSTAITTQKPAFTIHPGQSGLTAVRRLLNMVPDVILFSTDTAYLKNPQSSDASSYSYGTDHVILEGNYQLSTMNCNRAQVFGTDPAEAPLFTQDFDWDQIDLVYDRTAQAIDINLDTTTKAHQRGQAILRDAELEALDGHILVPLNCGQELYDVVDITCPQIGLNASKRRVLALTHTWTPLTLSLTQGTLSPSQGTLKIGIGAP